MPYSLFWPTYERGDVTLVNGDCLDVMRAIPDGSVDMVLCDLPYGTTACKWDSIIPFDALWANYRRVVKQNGAIVLTASQPFTTALAASNLEDFKYQWVWEKEQGVNFLLANKQPMKVHEDVNVFYRKQPTYNPQMTAGAPYISGLGSSGDVTGNVSKTRTKCSKVQSRNRSPPHPKASRADGVPDPHLHQRG